MADFSRTEMIFGAQGMERLAAARVAVFGLGGVGSYVAEALVRSGVGELLLVDGDVVSASNVNRQIIATQDTIGEVKAEVAKRRALSINPSARITAKKLFFTADTIDEIDFDSLDYMADAIDTVSSKLLLAKIASERGVHIISSMGTGGKKDPTRLEVADIYATDTCPLARVMRRELKRMGIPALKVVFSREAAQSDGYISENGRHAPGSCAFVPSVAGLIIASEIVRDIAEERR